MNHNNLSWPPGKDKYIIVTKTTPNNDIYIGIVKRILDNNKSVIIRLLKGFENPLTDVSDEYLKPTANPRHFMFVHKTDKWKYATEEEIGFTRGVGPAKHEELLYDDTHSGTASLKTSYYASATPNPNINVPLNKLIDSQDMDEFAFLTRSDIHYAHKEILQGELMIHQTITDVPIADKLGPDIRKLLLNKLECNTESSNIHKPQEILIADNMTISTMVNNTKTLEKEATKIIEYLSNKVFYLSGDAQEQNPDKVYGNLRFIYYNGYVHVFRTDIPLAEHITHQLLSDTPEKPKLKVLGLPEYNRPIRHNVLKYILFQNELQKNIKVDQELLHETELVLSQEYIIALTPEPRYQIWCYIRLIKLWYADIDLQNNIRKIKLLVNQYRARVDKKYNIHNGIRFSIGIYPRYGKASATIVLKKIMYYFALYFQAIGWKNNPPSYFKVVNDLISYANCDQSLKLYYRRIAQENGQKNTVFSKNFTTILSPGNNTDILEQYVRL